MIGVYFSGTGNSKHCVEKFVKCFDENAPAISIESSDTKEIIKTHDFIVFGYPVYFSDAPKIVKDFINLNGQLFNGKKIFIIATMGIASGDGAGCAARLFKKHGAKVIGGLHLKMPDSIADGKAFTRTFEKHKDLICKADTKIENAVKKLSEDKPTKNGLSFLSCLGGLFMQRLWFGGMTRSYKRKPKINKQECIGCGICEKICPMSNIKIINGRAESGDKCTLCYRCANRCPKKALTILGRQIRKQHSFEKHEN